MATVEAQVYKLTESANKIFRTIFPDLDPEAKYILISPEGQMTFREDPSAGQFLVPKMAILSYYDIEFDSE